MLLFVPLMRHLVRHGRLTVIDASGRPHIFGGTLLPDIPPVTIRLRDRRLHWRLALQPAVAFGEAFMDGTLTIEEGSLDDFLALVDENTRLINPRFALQERLSFVLRYLQQWNPVKASRRNVAHHYDLSDDFYALFLDADRQYSCAYFANPEMTLEEAQTAKKQHIISKLLLRSGQKVLDIGCGWGGLALSIARHADVEVTGITLSEHQLAIARQRAEEAQLSHRVKFMLADYRQISGQFDRIVSVGMFEHVGVGQYGTFFRRAGDLLTDKGIALLHSIGRSYGSGVTNAWIRKYIFPGGYCPALSEVTSAIEKSGLVATDIEILRPTHYAETLRHWRNRFNEQRAKVAAIYDERFCRMWELYLAGSESAFRRQGLMTWQMQFSRQPFVVPATRDYMVTGETELSP
ncbi:cyclopropane-fatty-acyl-phospholipid synthase family protein [Telmatospirillum sp.]|uniref:cyclopropane-fatty-acyl-phospholipid synthase family protein n=1 Tax=Telmatospirillum sp. TaxID=2079197 RepID=UPI0028484F7E|nr:cyclopropane-fatty-acyl-phospholipid synthase family protein [Telmatospirillum sp.]MDR3437200.1 cyclopropane-fatty-acyl-phospholipid synthase [Telmatospirillum sp.]